MLPVTTLLAVEASALSTDVREAPRVARRLGFAGLAFEAAMGGVDLTELSGTGRREFRQVVASQNQQIVGLRADLGVKGFAPGADVDRVLDRLDRILETARGLGAPLVCADLGRLPPAPAIDKPKPKVTSAMAGLILLPEPTAAPAPPPPAAPVAADLALASQVDGALFDLGQRADRYGVVVALRSDLAGFAALDRAVKRAGCPWFGIDLDPVALLRDEWEPDEVFSALGPLIRHVRGRDAVAGADRRTKPAVVGRGETDWPHLLARLDEAGYHGWITVDPLELPDRAAAAAAGREWIAKAR